MADAVQLTWTTWSEMLALCEEHGVAIEGGFLDAKGVFSTICPGMRAKMGALVRNMIIREGQWLSFEDGKPKIEDRAKVFKPDWSRKTTQPNVKLDDSPRMTVRRARAILLNKTGTLPPLKLDEGHYYERPQYGRSFGDVMASVREGIEEAKREMGIE